MLKIDREALAAYITFRNAKVHKTIEFGEEVFLDLDSNGNPIGMEIADITRPQKVAMFHMVARKYHIPELNRFHPDALRKVFA
ncbi:MAG: DUF2283 domain-containing protein [Candidatus Omnitrophota bacterium]|nr:DUF2283 domain-containing protein [Candidatus Omnitrophota bacterium]